MVDHQRRLQYLRAWLNTAQRKNEPMTFLAAPIKAPPLSSALITSITDERITRFVSGLAAKYAMPPAKAAAAHSRGLSLATCKSLPISKFGLGCNKLGSPVLAASTPASSALNI